MNSLTIRNCMEGFFVKSLPCLMRWVRVVGFMICVPAGAAQAQTGSAPQPAIDYKEVITEMQKRYGSVEKAHIVMKIGVFPSATSSKAFYQQSVEIWRDKQNYLCRMNEQDMLMNEKYLVLVDKTGREIICSNRNTSDENAFNDPLRANLDSLFSYYGRPAFVERKENINHFKLSLTKGELREVDLFIHNDSKLLTRVDYIYKDKQYARIDFAVFDTQPTIIPGTFDESQYVLITKSGMQPSKKMSHYRIVNAE